METLSPNCAAATTAPCTPSFLEAIRGATTFNADHDHVPGWLSGILRQRAHEVLQRRTLALGTAAMGP